MTIEELNKRRRKGLCFKCNEKFGPGHVCKKLFLIQATISDSDDDMEIEDDGVQEDLSPGVSLYAMARLLAPNTMRVLIDSGSTHNFVSEKMARKVGLQPISRGHIEVMVASGKQDGEPW